MNKKSPTRTTRPAPTMPDGRPLVVVGVRRAEPDWDGYIAALLSFALREVKEQHVAGEHGDER